MTTLASPPPPGSHGTPAARAAGRSPANGPSAGAGNNGDDAFANLMQALATPDAQADADAASADTDAGAGGTRPVEPPPAPQPCAIADAALAAVGAGLGTSLPAGVAAQMAAGGTATGEGGADTGDITPAGQAATLGPPPAAGGRGLAWSQPRDGLPAGFSAASQASAGEARPPGLARHAAGGSAGAAPQQFPGAGLGPQAPGHHSATDPATAPQVSTLIAQITTGTPEERRVASAAASPPPLSALDATAALAGSVPTQTSAPAPLHQADMASQPHEAGFAGELAAQVDVMVQGEIQQAELRLNPVDLGPIRIELRIEGNTADVVFSAAHDLTREGISRSLEQLRDMLASQGLHLGQADVGARHAGQEGQERSHPSRPALAGASTGDSEPLGATAPSRPRALRGMLDLYA